MVNGINGFGVSGSQNMGGATSGINGAEKTDDIKNIGSTGIESPKGECQTCKNRKYQDGSDENVSFKAAAHISPEASAARVMGHEKEHVANAYTKAAEKGGRVISAGVTLKMARCPECGRSYVAGGVTRTLIKYNKEDEKNPYNQMIKSEDADAYTGLNFDKES